HDIGKTATPEYFIENQNGATNIHTNISCEESAQRIISHVKNGLELAKKYNLPPQITDFITQHHGTSVTRYFYNTWINENPGQTPDKSKFQYPGPKPQSVELVAMMMTDAVEAASRTLKVYSKESITKLVNGIIDSQFSDGQYDDVDITIRQISKAKEILISKIENIYHARIEYPELNKPQQ
ncbi:MAG: HDIG domain-containing protein, partial [Bacteroidales bacterium]|nr:HDIG domain-containing protein [Bacteroidales bacterium]